MSERDKDMTEEIDLRESAVYVVKDGYCTKLLPMRSGQDQVIWKEGIVLDVVRSHRIRLAGEMEIGEN
ncbi:DUF3954 domain-containing protein [Planococcus sp. A6]|uniref:DUF3954 domain-containing protein n=1 Tax=Planococcus sp. A6 TaxID=2992760 RepID=UPI00237AFC85|nr:DUF3954 domain-containing protein [Planococcus sp. A6]MDE0581540.1 DUF3954 domain-containing protein [Planococcus sp. A6]